MQLNLMKMSNVFSLRQRPQQYTKIISTQKKTANSAAHNTKQSEGDT